MCTIIVEPHEAPHVQNKLDGFNFEYRAKKISKGRVEFTVAVTPRDAEVLLEQDAT